MDVHYLFLQDPMGKRFSDVMQDKRFNFYAILAFFADQERQHRMQIAQQHFKVPALGGVVVEMEKHPDFAFLAAGKHETVRLRQAIGVIAKVVMEQLGWQKSGTKGSMRSLSKHFTLSEMYLPPSK